MMLLVISWCYFSYTALQSFLVDTLMALNLLSTHQTPGGDGGGSGSCSSSGTACSEGGDGEQ